MKRSEAEPVAIITEKLSKRYNREWIFRDLDFEFDSGQCYAITGPNGSGKSTLIQVLCGYTPPSRGRLKYISADQEILQDDIFKRISLAAPYMDLIDEFTLDEQLRFHFELKPIRNNIQVKDLPEIMHLEKSKNKQIGNFSSGMKQRVKLALTFYTNSAVIFLDEPGTNLDRQAFDWYLKHLGELPDTSTVIIASNNPQEYPFATKAIEIMDFKP